MKNYLILVIFNILMIASKDLLAEDELENLSCSIDSDCMVGYSCRSKKGGGTECRNHLGQTSNKILTKTIECLTDSDCEAGQSCRSKLKGGTMCKPIDANFTSTVTSATRESKNTSNYQKQEAPEGYQLLREFTSVVNEFGQQIQRNNTFIPITPPNNQLPIPIQLSPRRINCIAVSPSIVSCH